MDKPSEFDYVLVGGGSAGCVLARRLSDDGRYRVLLLEAGGRDSYPWIHVPIGYGKTMFNQTVNWGYRTEAGANVNARSIYWPRGKVLGGSSSINGLIYIRGQAQDYEQWAGLGNRGWGWDDVLPYFIKSENQSRGADAYHGIGGPLAVSDITEPNELCEAFIHAGEQAGIPRNDDFNGTSQEGVGYFQLTTRNGRRCSTAVGYLRPALKRANLRVETRAQCTAIVLDEQRRARGVRYLRSGRRHEARARKEVIIAAGAVNSPQLLELSGIGDPKILHKCGLTIRHALPGVGTNLQDHLQARLVYRCTRPITTNDDLNHFFRKLRIGLRYVFLRRGPLAVGINQAGGFARTNPEIVHPDIQFHFGTLSSDQPGSPVHRFPGFTLSTCQLQPESTGTVHVTSSDPAQYPTIDANYLATETDRKTMVEGLKLGRGVTSEPAMQHYIADEYSPGPSVTSDQALLEFIRDDATTIFHPTGTCRMGQDRDAVVDHQLRVHGIDRLRVIDASIMPRIVSGNTNAAAIMIAEKGADMILSAAE